MFSQLIHPDTNFSNITYNYESYMHHNYVDGIFFFSVADKTNNIRYLVSYVCDGVLPITEGTYACFMFMIPSIYIRCKSFDNIYVSSLVRSRRKFYITPI